MKSAVEQVTMVPTSIEANTASWKAFANSSAIIIRTKNKEVLAMPKVGDTFRIRHKGSNPEKTEERKMKGKA